MRLLPPVPPEGDCESLRALYPSAHYDHAGHGRDSDLWYFRVSTAARQRPAERRLPHDFSQRVSSRRQSRHNGFFRCHPDGKAILDHCRHRFDDVHEFSWANRHHHSVQPQPEPRWRGLRRPGRHHRGGRPTASADADASDFPESESRRFAHHLPGAEFADDAPV